MRWREKYGPWAVVTGASDGIGREIATQLAEKGLSLVLVARRREILAKVAAELSERYHVETRIVAADLGGSGGVEQVIGKALSLDVGLLAAAAGYGTSGSFVDLDIERELNMVDVNCKAVVALSHHFARRFVSRKCGGLILMSSLVAFQGVPSAATYAATKAFVQTFAEGLRAELETHGVDVLASAPGPVRSGFEARADMKMSVALSPPVVARATIEALGRKGTVRPGFLSKGLEASLAPLPRRARVRMMGMVMGGMTKHQNAETAVKA
jgi:short-subunit dehydrogenase